MKFPPCAICFEPMMKNLGIGSCGHVYHKFCLEEWRKVRNSCPECNENALQNIRPIYFEALPDHDSDDHSLEVINLVSELLKAQDERNVEQINREILRKKLKVYKTQKKKQEKELILMNNNISVFTSEINALKAELQISESKHLEAQDDENFKKDIEKMLIKIANESPTAMESQDYIVSALNSQIDDLLEELQDSEDFNTDLSAINQKLEEDIKQMKEQAKDPHASTRKRKRKEKNRACEIGGKKIMKVKIQRRQY